MYIMWYLKHITCFVRGWVGGLRSAVIPASSPDNCRGKCSPWFHEKSRHETPQRGLRRKGHGFDVRRAKIKIIVMPIAHYRHVRGAQFICIKTSFQTTFVQ